MAFQAENDADIIAMTLHELGPYKWTHLATALQDHPVANEIMRREKTSFASGTSIDFNVQVNPQGSFRMVPIGAPDKFTYTPLMIKGNVPWRGSNCNMLIPAEFVSMNNEPSRIVDEVQIQRAGAFTSQAEGIESQAWAQPANSSDDLNSFGIPYWIVPNTVAGLNGLNPFGFSAGAGAIDSTVYAQWANYTDSYVEISKLDLILKMRKMALLTKFRTPVGVNAPSYNLGDRRLIMCPNYVFLQFSIVAEQQNDNLGNDIASKDHHVMFRGHEIMWVPKLDQINGQGQGGATGTFSNSTYTSTGGMPVNPVYFINFGWWRPVFLKGWWMRQEGPRPLWGINHTLIGTQWDTRFNFICRNRREQGVITM